MAIREVNIETKKHNNKVFNVILIIKDDVTKSLSGSENPRIIKVKNIIGTNSIQGYESILNNLRCCTLFFRHYQNQKELFLILHPYLVALLVGL